MLFVAHLLIPVRVQNKQGLKRTLFNETRQYNIQIFYKFIFLKYMTKQMKATETNK